MQKGRVTAVLTAYLVALRQLGNGKTMSRVEFAKLMLPHEVKKGKLLTIEGRKLFEWEGEDCEIIPEKLFAQKVATEAWLNNIVSSVNNNLLGTASVQAKNEAEDVDEESEPEAIAEDGVESEEAVEPSSDELEKAIEKAIKKGKKKKANKALADILEHGGFSKKEIKHYKKLIKEL